MNFDDFIRMAVHALIQNKRRSVLSLLGVVVGVVAVVSLTALGEGALRYVSDQFASLGSQTIMVMPGRNETTGGMPLGVGGIPNDLTIQDTIQIERRVQGVRVAVPITISADAVTFEERSRQSPIIGVTSDFLGINRLELASGSFLPPAELDRGSPVVVLGHTVARELFKDQNPLGQPVRIGGWRMRVIGTLKKRGHQLGIQMDESVLIPAPTGLRLTNRSSLTQIFLGLHPKADTKLVIEDIKEVLIERHNEEDFTCVAQDSVLESLTSILTILTLSVAGIASISLGVAGIGIMNVMLVSVSERTNEVGLMKAIGATHRQILVIFLLEAALLSLAGGVVGLGVGTGLVWFATWLYPAVPAATPYWAVAAVLALSFGTGIVFGVLPAWRASELDPVAALRGN